MYEVVEPEEAEEVVAVLRWLSETLPGRHLYNAEQELDCELMNFMHLSANNMTALFQTSLSRAIFKVNWPGGLRYFLAVCRAGQGVSRIILCDETTRLV